MKKKLAALLCLVLLTGCTRFNVNVQTAEPEQSGAESSAVAEGTPAEESAATAEQSPAEVSPAEVSPAEESAAEESAAAEILEPEAVEGEAYLTVTAADAFDGAYFFETEQAGSYRFAAAGPATQQWKVYVLEEEFEDAIRYLPQAHEPALTLKAGDAAAVDVAAQRYVYCACSVNSFTADAPAEQGSLAVYLTAAEPEEETLPAQSAEPMKVDARDIWDEGAYCFRSAEDATYTVSSKGSAYWEVYVLDEPFEESMRYLPQAAEPVVKEKGSFSVKAGQYVYCMSDENAFVEDEAPEKGQSVLRLEP